MSRPPRPSVCNEGGVQGNVSSGLLGSLEGYARFLQFVPKAAVATGAGCEAESVVSAFADSDWACCRRSRKVPAELCSL